MSDVPEEGGQERARSLGSSVVREAAAPEGHAEEGLGSDGTVRRVPPRMRAEENGEQPRAVGTVEHLAERLDDLPPDLREL